MDDKKLRKVVAEQCQHAAVCGFTVEYQCQKEQEDNAVCHSKLAPPTKEKHGRAVLFWKL